MDTHANGDVSACVSGETPVRITIQKTVPKDWGGFGESMSDDYNPQGKDRLILGEGAEAFDLMRCTFYLRGTTTRQTKKHMQRQHSPAGFAIQGLGSAEQTIRLHVSFLFKEDMDVADLVIVFKERPVFEYPIVSPIAGFEAGDLLNLTLLLAVDMLITL